MTPHVVVVVDRGTVSAAVGPLDEDEAGAICASAIAKGAKLGATQVVPLEGPASRTTFRVVHDRPAVGPTVYLVIGPSAIAYDQRGEILETVDFVDGLPDWSGAGICDHRGGGGPEGFELLAVALNAAERNAKLTGFDVRHLASEEIG